MKYLLALYLIGVSLFAQEVEVKRIALTFDDGPKVKVTEQILNVLKENEVKGTFFIVGVNGKRFPEILNKIYEEGHQIANHSYNHPNLRKLSMESVKKESTYKKSISCDIVFVEKKGGVFLMKYLLAL
ncbi:MAG: polysaccharide deacetylase family protein, partial [Cetobacterium sp.]